ncbi:transcription factor MYC2 [Vigna unguiculata]|uniref:Transcription factor MYC2 n=1 Tax=Vigna unguiculata TaxID=3917 RepID=A0A4D6LHT7_VIGUN|nr:transcription factor MYC2 [Vigna unguiculata]
MDKTYLHQETLLHIDDFELQDFVEDPNLDQLINFIRLEKKDAICDFNSELINEAFNDNSLLPHPATPYDQCNINAVNVYDSNSFSCFDGEAKREAEKEEDDMEHSSATTSTTTTTTTRTPTKSLVAKSKPKSDRSKTLISERRRRDRMKEKLYALRSLVPFITKMDKASIIGDAVSYMHELQAQANMLKSEVEALETSLLVSENYQGSIENPVKDDFTNNILSIRKKIIQMDMFQVDAKGFYVKIVCNKGEGVAASLYEALESLSGFHVQNSNLSTVGNSFQLTFSLNVKSSGPEINLHNLKIWVSEAFVKQGFEFIPLLMLDSFNL